MHLYDLSFDNTVTKGEIALFSYYIYIIKGLVDEKIMYGKDIKNNLLVFCSVLNLQDLPLPQP